MTRILKIFFHDACFDGTASAALFGRFYRDVIDPGARVIAIGVQHRDGDPFAGLAIDGDDNACVDFRYSAAPAMRWWFDHHRTAFQPPSLRAHFEADTSGKKFFDPAAPSCTGFIARTLRERWGWRPDGALVDVVRWAEVIDAARFGSAQEAASVQSSAQQLALWLGHVNDPELIAKYVTALPTTSLDELATQPWIRTGLEPLIHARGRARDRLEEVAQVQRDVVLFDLLDDDGGVQAGFVAYELFPDCRYTVAMTRGPNGIKIAVGSNPWAPMPRSHDLGEICERHGGGGHAAVGGVTLGRDEIARARAAGAAIAAELLG